MVLGEGTLVVEMTDDTHSYNRCFRENVGFYYDLVKANLERIVIGLTAELAGTTATAVAVTPGWLPSERMLENFGVTEANWRDALERAPHFCVSESPTYVGRGIAALASDPDAHRYAGRVCRAPSSPAPSASPIPKHATRLLALPGGNPERREARHGAQLPLSVRDCAVRDPAGKWRRSI